MAGFLSWLLHSFFVAVRIARVLLHLIIRRLGYETGNFHSFSRYDCMLLVVVVWERPLRRLVGRYGHFDGLTCFLEGQLLAR